jgi:hypothetical protein
MFPPTYKSLAKASPPAIVIAPPAEIEEAFAESIIDKPPVSTIAPVDAFELSVEFVNAINPVALNVPVVIPVDAPNVPVEMFVATAFVNIAPDAVIAVPFAFVN